MTAGDGGSIALFRSSGFEAAGSVLRGHPETLPKQIRNKALSVLAEGCSSDGYQDANRRRTQVGLCGANRVRVEAF
jgi:hypothetical protein